MKKKLTEAIKAKFVGIDENTAMRLADRALRKGEPITTDDEVAAAVEAITLSDVLKSVSDFSSDEATRKYEAKYGLENGVPKKTEKEEPKKEKEVETQKDKGADPMTELKALFSTSLKELSGKIESINSEIASIRSGKLAETRKAKLDQVIKGLRESQKKAYSRIPLDRMSDDEFETFISEATEEVNDIIAENKAGGSVVTPLGGLHHNSPDGKDKEATKEELDNLVGKFNFKTN